MRKFAVGFILTFIRPSARTRRLHRHRFGYDASEGIPYRRHRWNMPCGLIQVLILVHSMSVGLLPALAQIQRAWAP